jgi:hypothetical protein
MFVVILAIGLVTAGALALGVPWLLALIAGLVIPGLASWGYLRISGQDAPTSSLDPTSPRTAIFLRALSNSYRADGWAQYADAVDAVADLFREGKVDEGNARFRQLSSAAAHDPRSTRLVAIWQQAWKDAGRSIRNGPT